MRDEVKTNGYVNILCNFIYYYAWLNQAYLNKWSEVHFENSISEAVEDPILAWQHTCVSDYRQKDVLCYP